MIKSLHIKNFQSHKDSLLEFSPGVNVLIGSSDTGKSSVWRALDLVINNRPTGSGFVSHWCKNEKGNYKDNTEITLNVDGREITRIKGKDNKYILDKEELKAFKTDVPDPVKELMNTDEINVQHQANNFFLLNLSAGKVAEELNRLVNLDIIDRTLSNVNGRLRKMKASITSNEEDIIKHETSLEKFSKLSDMEVDLNAIVVLQKEYEELQFQMDALGDCTNKIQLAQIELNKCKDFTGAEEAVSKLESLYSGFMLLSEQYDALESLYESIEAVEKELETEFDPAVEEEIEIVGEMIRKYNLLKSEMNDLDTVIQMVSETEETIENQNYDIEKAEKVYQEVLEEYNKTKNICPECGQIILEEVV